MLLLLELLNSLTREKWLSCCIGIADNSGSLLRSPFGYTTVVLRVKCQMLVWRPLRVRQIINRRTFD